MEKRRLFRILNRVDTAVLAGMAERVAQAQEVTLLKEPARTLAMIRLREPVEAGLFYLGEVIVCEAMVALGDTRGMAVTMTMEPERALHMAVIDAAVNHGVFAEMDALLALEREQQAQVLRENALHHQTMVDFHAMDAEVPT